MDLGLLAVLPYFHPTTLGQGQAGHVPPDFALDRTLRRQQAPSSTPQASAPASSVLWAP